MDETIKVYEEFAEEYDEISGNKLDDVVNHLRFFLETIEGDDILDLGCGSGRDAEWFSEKGKNVVGIDLSENLLDIAKKKAPNAVFNKMDIRNLGFEKEDFDGIWASGSIHHITKDEAETVLEELHHILKHQGLLYVSVKKGKGERYVRDGRIEEGKRFFSFYEEDELNKLISKAGFEIIKSEHDSEWIVLFAKKIPS